MCVALLCAAQTNTALQETAQHLLPFLTMGPMPEDSTVTPGDASDLLEGSTLLADTLRALSTAARSSRSFPDTTDDDIFQTSQSAASLPVLVQLLAQVTTAGEHNTTCMPVLVQWFRSVIAYASEPYPSSVLSELLPVVVPALRTSEADLLDSGVAELTQQLLSRSAKLPPAAAVMSQSSNPDKLANILQTLDTICACFPCPSTPLAMPSGGRQATAVGQGSVTEAVATAAEKQALMAVTLRQMQGERSVALAAAAAKRATEGQEAESSTAAAASTSGGYVISSVHL